MRPTSGTLFLYASRRAELLLLVQNTHYAEAIESGLVAAAGAASPVHRHSTVQEVCDDLREQVRVLLRAQPSMLGSTRSAAGWRRLLPGRFGRGFRPRGVFCWNDTRTKG